MFFCSGCSSEYYKMQVDDFEAIEKVKILDSRDGADVGTVASNISKSEWFSLTLLDSKEEYSGELVGFIDTRRGINNLYIWFVSYQNEVYYVNLPAKRLTSHIKKAPNIDSDWAYKFCQKKLIVN